MQVKGQVRILPGAPCPKEFANSAHEKNRWRFIEKSDQ
jgi:hypothetical protein